MTIFFEKELVRKLNIEFSQIKVKLEKANRWTHSSRIVNKLSDRVHNEKADEKIGHPTT